MTSVNKNCRRFSLRHQLNVLAILINQKASLKWQKMGSILLLIFFSILICGQPLKVSAASSDGNTVAAQEAAVVVQSTTDNKAKEMNAFLNMKLTYGLYLWVLGQPLAQNKMKQNFEYSYFSEKQQLNILFSVWKQLLESGQYKNTSEIFYVMKKYYPYFAKYMDPFLSMTSRNPQLQLPHYRNTFLAAVLLSEREIQDPYARTEKLIDKIGQFLFTPEYSSTNGDQTLGSMLLEVIGQKQKNNTNPLADLAIEIRSQKVFSTTVYVLSAVKGLFEFGAGRLITAAVASSSVQLFRRMVLGSAATVVKKNPMATALTISAGLHGLFFYQQRELALALQPLPNVDSEVYSSKQVQVLSVIQRLAKAGALLFDLKREQVVGFEKPSVTQSSEKNKLISEANAYLKGLNNNFDFLNFFIQAEKLQATAGFSSADVKTFDLIIALADKLKTDVVKIQKTNDLGALEEFRQLLIGNYLHLYRRENPNLLTVFLGWGGNCVARTMLFIGLLQKNPQLLPPDAELFFGLYQDHMEPIVLYHGKYYLLMAGVAVSTSRAVLYLPNDLIRIALAGFNSAAVKKEGGRDGLLEGIAKSYFKNTVKFSEEDQIPLMSESKYSPFVEKSNDEGLVTSAAAKPSTSGKGGPVKDRNCLKVVYVDLSSDPDAFKKYPFQLKSNGCLFVEVHDFDLYVEFSKRESVLLANPVDYLREELIKYFYNLYADKELQNYFDNNFLNFDFIGESPANIGLNKKLQLLINSRLDLNWIVSNYNLHVHSFFGLKRFGSPVSYSYEPLEMIMASGKSQNIVLANDLASDAFYKTQFLKLEKKQILKVRTFFKNIEEHPFEFARNAKNAGKAEQFIFKKLFQYTDYFYEVIQGSSTSGPLDTDAYLALFSHNVRHKVDMMAEGAVDLSTRAVQIQLPEVSSAETWRWGKVVVAEPKNNAATAVVKIEQKDLLSMMTFVQSGLQFWTNETLQIYFQNLQAKDAGKQKTMLRYVFDNFHRLKAQNISLLHLQVADLQLLSKYYMNLMNQNNKIQQIGSFKVTMKTKDPLAEKPYWSSYPVD